ncbi:MAG: 4'-phosphopantetheinyl transferase superfamily protein [Bacteroidales bacterium]|nr:4'-phosphopantetheinyl transferase superfamily protein [Bacteroidales bacterium]
MEYFVCTIEECEKAFGIDKSLSRPKQISLLAKQQLLSIIKEKGLSFPTTIAVKEKGKPYFLYNENLHFSISHTKSLIAIALHNKEIGIDIENTRKCNLNLAKRYFHQEEYIYLSSLPKEEQDEAFTKIWTQKEAYVKCTGEGIAGGFNKFSVIANSLTIGSQYNIQYQVKDYHLSLCFES